MADKLFSTGIAKQGAGAGSPADGSDNNNLVNAYGKKSKICF